MRRLLFIALGVLTAALFIGAISLAVGPSGGLGGTPEARKLVPAPIDGLEVTTLRSSPPQYVIEIQAGLPSGCAEQESHEVTRDGNTVTVTVLNSMPTGDPMCTMIYGTYELSLNLGSDFRPGTTYTVRVNDKTTSFVAQ